MDNSRLNALKAKLAKHEQCIKSSDLYTHTIALLRPLEFTFIRCLALGSVTLEFQALYQFAYLRLIVEEFSIPREKVSLYDPAFTADDTYFLEEELHYKVEQSDQFNENHNQDTPTLYYMPHAPRTLTEEVLRLETPTILLANDFSVTSGTLTKAKFFEGFPVLATLVHVWDNQQQERKSIMEDDSKDRKKVASSESVSSEGCKPLQTHAESDGFMPVVNRKRRTRSKKNVFVEPEIEYDILLMYFENVGIVRIKSDPDAAWRDSFSDLALNTVVKKENFRRKSTA